MLKKTTGWILLMIILLPLRVYGLEIPGYEGGIQNEMLYREVIFITGEPIVVEGTLTVKDQGNRVTYTFRNLTNAEKGVSLTRNITYTKNTELHGKNQRTEAWSIDRYRETINVNGIRYEADENSHQWSKSSIYHLKPGVTYFAGSWDGRKVYNINRNEGRVTVETRGSMVGYDHAWGTIQTQTISKFIQYERRMEGTEGGNIRWQGTVEINGSHNRTKDYHFEVNAPTQISFRGAYRLTEQEKNILKYSYDLPRLNEDGTVRRQRNTGNNSFSLDTNPVNRKLSIPSIRDVGGHWAEESVLFLASLGAFYSNSVNFGPALPMNRGDFARAIAVVMDLKKEQPVRRQRNMEQAEEPQLFADVPKTHSNKDYIQVVYEKGIMEGVGKDRFVPNQSLTKAQAAVALIKTLGFENLAPLQQYSTGFRDDNSIPYWARDAVYLSKRLGLISGTADGYFQPNKELTKAEAAAMLVNFINYLQKDLRYDYRERILNY